MQSMKKVIGSIEFGILSPQEIRKMSAAEITVPDTYDDDGYPIEGGLMDKRLGVIDPPGLRCETCGARRVSVRVTSATSSSPDRLFTSALPRPSIVSWRARAASVEG